MAPGDSGAPAFIDGRIAGVASFRLRLQFTDGVSSDVDDISNASFGEFNAFTRASLYDSWINPVPEPGTATFCDGGVGGGRCVLPPADFADDPQPSFWLVLVLRLHRYLHGYCTHGRDMSRVTVFSLHLRLRGFCRRLGTGLKGPLECQNTVASGASPSIR